MEARGGITENRRIAARDVDEMTQGSRRNPVLRLTSDILTVSIATTEDGVPQMHSDLMLEFIGVEATDNMLIDDGRPNPPGWQVTFAVKTDYVAYDAIVFVAKGCPKEDIVRRAMHLFHLQAAELAHETVTWRLPATEKRLRSAPPSTPE